MLDRDEVTGERARVAPGWGGGAEPDPQFHCRAGCHELRRRGLELGRPRSGRLDESRSTPVRRVFFGVLVRRRPGFGILVRRRTRFGVLILHRARSGGRLCVLAFRRLLIVGRVLIGDTG